MSCRTESSHLGLCIFITIAILQLYALLPYVVLAHPSRPPDSSCTGLSPS